jgi:hypothetical protein
MFLRWSRAIAIDQGLHERYDMENLSGASIPWPADVNVTIIWPSMANRTFPMA